MREELLELYERELTYLRQMGGAFARKHPRIAGRLQFDATGSTDPHVERLIQSFAFMAARVHRRLEDDFPQLSETLLDLIYPSYLRPVPAMTVVECLPDPAQGKKTASSVVLRETVLVSRHTVDGLPVRFRTAYDVTLWPLRISQAEWRQPERLPYVVRSTTGTTAVAAARLRLSCFQDVTFTGLPLSTLRMYLFGDPGVIYPLYELISANCMEVQLCNPSKPDRVVTLNADPIKMVGFEANQSLLPFDRRSVNGHRLLQEYFSFPQKFLFFDLNHLDVLGEGQFGSEVDIILLFSRFDRPERQQVLELGVTEQTFRLGCTPAINLFRQTAEPILISQTESSYPVVPSNRHAEVMEIYSLDEVEATNPKLRQSFPLQPLLSYRHQTNAKTAGVFWSATRKLNELGERRPSTVHVSVVDLNGRLQHPDADVLVARCTCSNFDVPWEMPIGESTGDFDAVGAGAAKFLTALHKPTRTVDPPQAVGQLWRLTSQLSLNYLSLSEAGREALQEILRLHNFTDSSSHENQIGAIRRLSTGPHFALVASDYGLAPARGTAVEIELDEQQFTGGSAFLFSAVLDRFLAGYASINSFAQLTARTTMRKEPMHTWPPRAGTEALL